MARAPRPALIAALALSSGACTPPQYHFQLEDLSVGNPAPPAKILVGEHVVVRAENGGGPDGWRLWARIDVFPVGAVLAGAWVKIRHRPQPLRGPGHDISRPGALRGGLVGGPRYPRLLRAAHRPWAYVHDHVARPRVHPR